MKNSSKLMLATLALLSIGNSAFGYIYTFTNRTKENVYVAVKLSGVEEPWYIVGGNPYKTKGPQSLAGYVEKQERYIKPGETAGLNFMASDTVTIFSPNFERDKYKNDYARKFGFWIVEMMYSNDGRSWDTAVPYFITPQRSQQLLKATSQLVQGIGETTGTVLSLFPETSTIGKAVEKLPLDKLISSAGALREGSMVGNRHFTVIPNMDLISGDKPGEIKVAEFLDQPLFITIAE